MDKVEVLLPFMSYNVVFIIKENTVPIYIFLYSCSKCINLRYNL